MEIYRLCTFYNDFTKKNDYFVGETGLETAKMNILLAKNNENVYAAYIYLRDIDIDCHLISDELLIEEFVRN